MALTVNPDARAGGLDTFREEGLYAFRFDLNDFAREEVTLAVRAAKSPATLLGFERGIKANARETLNELQNSG